MDNNQGRKRDYTFKMLLSFNYQRDRKCFAFELKNFFDRNQKMKMIFF